MQLICYAQYLTSVKYGSNLIEQLFHIEFLQKYLYDCLWENQPRVIILKILVLKAIISLASFCSC